MAKLRPGTIVRDLEVRHLVDRMYGPQSATIASFGYDLDAVVWQELVVATCTMHRYSVNTCIAIINRWSTIQEADERETKDVTG